MKQFAFTSLLVFCFSFGLFSQDAKKMTAHFINVGQADATLLEFPCGAILIDAGAQDTAHENDLIDYLEDFFKRRSDLNKTLDLVIITHAHIDHNLALDEVVKQFKVKRYIDNGLSSGSGKKNQNWLQETAPELGIQYATYTWESITENGNKKGITDAIIDPINCSEINPSISLLSGSFSKKPDDWSSSDYKNGNNQSIVVRVTFGSSSFLFTGDLEVAGLETLQQSCDSTVLDNDILRVGHHGAANATTPEYLNAVTPDYAIISCGQWNYGLKSKGSFNTYSYGHPRINILNQLDSVMVGTRPKPITIKAALGSKKFTDYTVSKQIYATPWDNTIQLQADDKGKYRILEH
jgi:beta-lactamase superfamily II metal-dependent hydrolase